MRTLLRLALFLAAGALLLILGGFCWLYFYARDLPDIDALSRYAPTAIVKLSEPSLGSSVALPYESLGANIRNAISATEAREDDPGVLSAEFLNAGELHRRTLPAAISRTLPYPPCTSLRRQLAELRTAIQLDRHFSRQQLFTIFANRVVLGPSVIGLHDGAEFYFRREPAALSVADAALLAGVIRGPSWLSPVKHPDRALRRRNEVLDAMAAAGSITPEVGQAAKAAPLGIVASATAP